MSDEKTQCLACARFWNNDTEQAAAIRLYGICIVCCVESEKARNFKWSIDKVVEERKAWNTRAGEGV